MKKKLSKLIIPVLLIILLSDSNFGQEFRFNNISIDDGLIQNTILDIFEDSRGFIWIATEEGLDRYDGVNFVHYKNDPNDSSTISSNWVRSICEHPKGILWIGTEGGGLNKFEVATEKFKRFLHNPDNSNSISSNDIRDMFVDDNGFLWIATDGGGLNKFNINEETFTNYKILDNSVYDEKSNKLWTTFYDFSNSFIWSKKYIWLGTYNNGIKIFNKETEKFINLNFSSTELNNAHIRSIYFDRLVGNKIWIGTTNKGLYWFELSNNLSETENIKLEKFNGISEKGNSINNSFVRCIKRVTIKHDNHILLIGTHGGGLNIFDPIDKSFKYLKNDQYNPSSLVGNAIITMFIDRNDILWIGSYSRGISKLDKEKKNFNHFSVTDNTNLDASYNQIWDIETDKKNNLWIGTDVGLFVLDQNYNHIESMNKRYDKYFSGESIFQIYKDPFDKNDVIWVGTRTAGLYRIDNDNKTIKSFKNNPDESSSISSNFVRSILRDDEEKDIYWIATFGGGLSKFNISSGSLYTYQHDITDSTSISHNYIWQIYKDSKGNYWCGTKGGLNKFDPKTGKFKSFTQNKKDKYSISYNHVFSIFEDSSGRLWICTFGGGLNLFDEGNGKFYHIKEEDGLANNVVYGILEDDDKNLWVSTNLGISKITINKLPNEIDSTFINYLTFSNFDVDDGLQSNEFNANAYTKTEDGELYFGGINGFNYFFPNKIIKNQNIAEVYFTSFKKFNSEVDLDTSIVDKKVIELDYSENMISFEFMALNFVAPNKNQYAYKLEGFHDNWIHLGNKNNIDLTNLPNGELKLNVIASNDDNVWNTKGANIKLIIYPPFYETWLFRILFGASIISIIILLYRQRTKFIRENNRTLNEINTRLNTEIEEKNRVSKILELNEHRFRTLYENSIIGIYKMTVEGNPLMINPALMQILKLEKFEDLGKIDISKDIYVKYGERERFYKELKENGEVIGFETDWKIGDGSIVTIRENAKIIKDNINNTEFIEGSVENITEKKRIEREVLKAKNEAEKSNQLKSEFLAQMSHEIRTPINTLLSYSSLIKSEMEKDLNEETLYCFTAMNNAGKRITRTIDMILNMSEIQSGSYELIKKSIDLGENILEKIYNEYKFIAAEQGLLLKYVNESQNSIVKVDDYTVTQLFVNLIDNAIKYTEKGSVTIKLLDEENSLAVKIIDTGIGISEEYLPTIFDAFTQEEQGYTRQYEGNGLGLALVKNYCFMNKAKIEVESEKGVGTTFTVKFNSK